MSFRTDHTEHTSVILKDTDVTIGSSIAHNAKRIARKQCRGTLISIEYHTEIQNYAKDEMTVSYVSIVHLMSK